METEIVYICEKLFPNFKIKEVNVYKKSQERILSTKRANYSGEHPYYLNLKINFFRIIRTLNGVRDRIRR